MPPVGRPSGWEFAHVVRVDRTGFVTAAAGDLTNLGSSISAANASAAVRPTQVLDAGDDEVSALIAAMFAGLAWSTQASSAQVAGYHSGLCRPWSTARADISARPPR
ncbi:PE family protein [Mycobacterium tuberculosis]|uniref:PE family protein n=1 Tax=Mycobacterium tuberculosis TaxID=1773 RepID=UPI0034580341